MEESEVKRQLKAKGLGKSLEVGEKKKKKKKKAKKPGKLGPKDFDPIHALSASMEEMSGKEFLEKDVWEELGKALKEKGLPVEAKMALRDAMREHGNEWTQEKLKEYGEKMKEELEGRPQTKQQSKEHKEEGGELKLLPPGFDRKDYDWPEGIRWPDE